MSIVKSFLEIEEKEKTNSFEAEKMLENSLSKLESAFAFVFDFLNKIGASGEFSNCSQDQVRLLIYNQKGAILFRFEFYFNKMNSDQWFLFKSDDGYSRVYSEEQSKLEELKIMCQVIEFISNQKNRIELTWVEYNRKNYKELKSQKILDQQIYETSEKKRSYLDKIAQLYLQKIQREGTVVPFFQLSEIKSAFFNEERRKLKILGLTHSKKEIEMAVGIDKFNEMFKKCFSLYRDVMINDLYKFEIKNKISSYIGSK